MRKATWICDGKVPYDNQGQAKQAIKQRARRIKRGWAGGGQVNAYLCALCRKWHIGFNAREKTKRL